MRRFCQLLTLAATLSAIGLAQSERVVLTTADLVRMAETGLPSSLMVQVVESADEVPVLQPQEIVDLSQAGVPAPVLEAVVARRSLRARASTTNTAAARPPAGQISIAARLEQRRGLVGAIRRGPSDLAVYWGAAALGDDGAVLPIESCPKQAACWCVSETGDRACVSAEDSAWRERFSCFQAMELASGQDETVFALEAPQGMTELRVYPFYMVQEKNGAARLTAWDSAGSAAYVRVAPGGTDYTAEAGLALSVGRNAKTDMTLPVRRFDSAAGRPGGSGRISIETLTMSTTPLPQACGQQP